MGLFSTKTGSLDISTGGGGDNAAANKGSNGDMGSGGGEGGGGRVALAAYRLTTESRASLGSGLSSLYAMALVVTYLAFEFLDLVTFPKYFLYLENHGFFLYLYMIADFYLVYVLVFTIAARLGRGRKDGFHIRGYRYKD